MNFNNHFSLKDKHAFLSPSNYHWVNYDEEKLRERYITSQAAKEGTILHAFAAEAIKLGIKLKSNGSTLSAYVNDAIDFKMAAEQTLFYSDNCFGHADAISFRRNVLRIHDLKTGVSPASVTQLLVYAALFNLEYGLMLGFKPFDIQYNLRIYQSDEVQMFEVDPMDVFTIMDRIVSFDKVINSLKVDE